MDMAAEAIDAQSNNTARGSATGGDSTTDSVSQLPGPTSNPDPSTFLAKGRGQLSRPPKKLRKGHNVVVYLDGKDKSGGFLFLCVNWDSLVKQLGQIKLVDNSCDIHHVTDEALCKMLRREYKRLRGWRYWISLQTIYYFRFVKVRLYVTCTLDYQLTARLQFVQYVPSLADPGFKEELPPQGQRTHYRITNPPGPPPPPIGRGELMRFYNDPKKAATRKFLCSQLPIKTTGSLGSDRVEGWGLHAQEQPAMVKIAMLGLVLCIATLWFVPYWLNRHPGDLSNAVALPALAWTFLTVCVVLPWWVVPTEIPD